MVVLIAPALRKSLRFKFIHPYFLTPSETSTQSYGDGAFFFKSMGFGIDKLQINIFQPIHKQRHPLICAIFFSACTKTVTAFGKQVHFYRYIILE